MSLQSLNPELAAKILLLTNLQRNLIQNQNIVKENTAEKNNLTSALIGQQQSIHPLLMPSLNVSSQKISAMLAALTPSLLKTMPLEQPSLATSSHNTINSGMVNSSANIRSNASSFGWGNRERKMEENWRMQNRNV
ncbi:unnamed protein product [Rotaria socialis]|uniref:Uncharacterized protein n=1 Tax=Rotaria socialis TaxID=392032 RepID=A0A818KDU4_9BILA|nr:unnamed protein product [Rotaria socialis]CAF3553662.1 unnamed protein product [Rotaria socialis]